MALQKRARPAEPLDDFLAIHPLNPSLSRAARLNCGPMQTFRNLVPDSALVEETIRLLHSSGGRAPATEVCANVLELPDLDETAASSLVNELIGEDWRLRVTDDKFEVEVLCEDDECRALT